MSTGGQRRRLRKRLMLPLAAALGVAVVALPAVASSETSTIDAVDETHGKGLYEETTHRWSPVQVSVLAGGSVAIRNTSTTTAHGVRWVGGPTTPSCTAGVPVGSSPAASATNWSGTCTFARAGTYTFYCTVHGPEMHGTVSVNSAGETTGSTVTTPSTTTGTPPGGEGGGGGQGGPGSPQYGSAPGSPLAGSASSAVKVAAAQRGNAVRGAIEVSQAGAGGRLEVDLFAKKASLASAGGAQAAAGRLVLFGVHAGQLSFSVPLNGRARKALRHRHRLALTLRIRLQAPGASALTLTRSLVLRP